MSEYTIKIITSEDKPKILSFLRKHFYENEPLNQGLSRLDGEEANSNERGVLTVDAVDNGLSFMALTNDNEVIGICLNDDQEESICGDVNPRQLKIHTFFKMLEEGAQLSKLENPDDLEMSLNILTVHPKWGRKGIGLELVEQTVKLAIEKGYRQIKTICTGAYSAKIFEKLEFRCANTIKYEDYKEDGIIVFKPDPPHTCVKYFVLKL